VLLDNVTVIYGSNRALKEVSGRFVPGLSAARPEWRGKSTLLKALLGSSSRRWTMTVFDLDVARHPLEIRARIGYMPESDGHIPGMNAVSFVALLRTAGRPARVDAMQRAHEVLYYVGLGEARYRNVETYSTGMKQRIKLAQALVHDPICCSSTSRQRHGPEGRDEMLDSSAISATTRMST
jgi:ABC-2 type transport system ATP-binding protein